MKGRMLFRVESGPNIQTLHENKTRRSRGPSLSLLSISHFSNTLYRTILPRSVHARHNPISSSHLVPQRRSADIPSGRLLLSTIIFVPTPARSSPALASQPESFVPSRVNRTLSFEHSHQIDCIRIITCKPIPILMMQPFLIVRQRQIALHVLPERSPRDLVIA